MCVKLSFYNVHVLYYTLKDWGRSCISNFPHRHFRWRAQWVSQIQTTWHPAPLLSATRTTSSTSVPAVTTPHETTHWQRPDEVLWGGVRIPPLLALYSPCKQNMDLDVFMYVCLDFNYYSTCVSLTLTIFWNILSQYANIFYSQVLKQFLYSKHY